MEEKKIPGEIINSLRIYNKIANWNRALLIILGLTSILSSTLVTAYINTGYLGKDTIHFWSFVSTVTIAIVSSFGLSVKGNNARTGYRLLLNATLLYKADLLQLEGLIKTYAEAEKILGSVDFNSK